MIRRAISKLHIMRVSKPSLMKKTVAAPLRSTTTIYTSAQCFIPGIGGDISHSETSCSSFEGRRNTLTSLDDHDDAGIDSMSLTTLDDDESDKVGKQNYGQCAEAVEPVYDSDCRNLSVRSDTTYHYGPESQMEKGQDQAKDLSSSAEAGFTTAAAVPLHTSEPKYRCATRRHGWAEIRVGQGDHIARWRRGSIVTYTVDSRSFPTLKKAKKVKAAMQDAISMWKGIAVSFKYLKVKYCDSATFVVRYDRRRRSDTYAVSFFPDESPGDLVVYDLALTNAYYLASILAHEIGHILGLRHEFAVEKESELGCVLVGENNTRSIMNYHTDLKKLKVGEQDLRELKEFYAHDGAWYKGLPIHECVPILPRRISRKKTRRFSSYTALTRLGLFVLQQFTASDKIETTG